GISMFQDLFFETIIILTICKKIGISFTHINEHSRID
ncbi:hypothetical protein A5865_000112, partial [Enterococcus sp. 12E11_DIV0728]